MLCSHTLACFQRRHYLWIRHSLRATVSMDTILCFDRERAKITGERKTCNIPCYPDQTREPQRQERRRKEGGKENTKYRNAGDIFHETDLGTSRTNGGFHVLGLLIFPFMVNLFKNHTVLTQLLSRTQM